MDAGVNPDGRAVRAPFAELQEKKWGRGGTTRGPGIFSPHKPLLPCLEHVEGAVFCRPADLELADQVGVFSHQQVHEGVDLGVGEGLGGQ